MSTGYEARPLALDFPLRGSQLIEASAGTGKTFTISALYVRLVLGHGLDESGFGRELLPPEILVMTFTDAATKELRDRIRARLAQAARFFREEIEAPDPLVDMLRDDFDYESWASCANKLDIAAQWMDEAAVSTIHGWCQRMLREHAFDSGSLFTQTLETDHTDLLAEVVRDYWRRHCYSLDGTALAWVEDNWRMPDNLRAKLGGLLKQAGDAPTDDSLAGLMDKVLTERRNRVESLKAPWTVWAAELRELFDGACQRKQVNAKKFQARWYNPWCDKLHAWANDPDLELLELGTGFERMTPEFMAEIAVSGEPLSHPGLDAMRDLKSALDDLPRPDALLLEHAAHWVRNRFDAEKRRRAEMGFDDMLTRLDAALQGPNGSRLADLIRMQFPVALVDEFQDTDPVQYRIFDLIYQVHNNRDDSALLMIGDPKQAIYAFRGADIYTYLRARSATDGRHYTLGTNFRSSVGMVDAVNHVFDQAEQRPTGQGAFLFRRGRDNPVPFKPVEAQGRKEQFVVEGEVATPLTCWHLASDIPVSNGYYRERVAATAASEIVRLLNLAQQSEAGFAGRDGDIQPLRPADIAILVRDFAEAHAIRSALGARGVRSVYLSDKDSVFDGQEARDLLLWLKACAEPDTDRPLRAALATRTLGLSLNELEHINQDERVWENRVLQFRRYRDLWRRQGVLPMLRRLLHDFGLPRALVARTDGERVLTNLLHLAELMQQAASELDGEQALIRHLAEHLEPQGQTSEDQVLRLESDEQLVKVVTIHKSKGLEYPLVFLPFICSFRGVDKDRPPVRYHGDDGELIVRTSPDAADVERADQERLAEDLRLLYVALTRARHACWLGVADLKRGAGNQSLLHRSALGYLLGGGLPLAASPQLGEWLEALAAPTEHLRYGPLPEPDDTFVVINRPARREPQVRRPVRDAAENWWIASYSALRIADKLVPGDDKPVLGEDGDLSPESAEGQKVFDDDTFSGNDDPAATSSKEGLHRFPRGPNPGTFLHGLLEWAGEEGFGVVANDPEAIEDAVARRCNRRGWEAWIKPLSTWLADLLNDALPLGRGESPVRLAALDSYQVEMEFWFQSTRVEVDVLDALVRTHTLGGAERKHAEHNLLNGMFKGFIDLTFEHEGRYYVADYKSNWLGVDDQAYTTKAMRDEILAKRYDLQYVLYLLALHRQLKARLPDYDYDEHIGGALYMFVRGAGSPTKGLFFDKPERELIEQLDALFSGAVIEEGI